MGDGKEEISLGFCRGMLSKQAAWASIGGRGSHITGVKS